MAWYEVMDDEYHRDTRCRLGYSEEEIRRGYEGHCRDQQRVVEAEARTEKLALHVGMIVRRRTEDSGVYRVTGWSGVPSLDGVAISGINADLTARGTVTMIPSGITLFCCANMKGDPQYTYVFQADEVDRMETA